MEPAADADPSGQAARIALWFLLIGGVVWLVGQAVSRRMSEGDEHSPDFTLVTFMRGRRFTSRARALRSARIVGWLGGSDIDLRKATLDPAGAELTLRIALGGSRVIVRDDWSVGVDVDSETRLGDVQVSVTPLAELQDDEPPKPRGRGELPRHRRIPRRSGRL